MLVLADSIALFIEEMMGKSDEISLQRNELAQHFACAPSQINYVLSTRFTLARGYIIISRRGGGGCIRVLRVDANKDSLLHELACNQIGEAVSQRDANNIILRLLHEKRITEREANIMIAGMEGLGMPIQEMGDAARARVLRAMLTALMRGCGEEGV